MSALNIRSNVLGNSVEKTLSRMTLACMLWEDQFYTDGVSQADILKNLVAKADPKFVQALAVEARSSFKLRHVPLLLARELARKNQLPAGVLAEVIQRPDEMGEFLSMYWKDGKTPISNQVKKGLAKAFLKFNEYSLAKFDKNSAAISVRDVMFLTHVKPATTEQENLFKRIAAKEMKTPDTWETELSAGADKAETFSRLMAEKKLGALAFLRNLRNMVNAGVPESTIRAYSRNVDVSKVLPFRYLSAAKIVPQFKPMLEEMMFRSLGNAEKLKGRTVLVIDTSGSMNGAVSAKSDLNRLEAAAALAVLAREICEDVVIYATAGDDGRCTHATAVIPPLRGFALADYFRGGREVTKLGGGGIFLIQCMDYIAKQEAGKTIDRVLVFTDEQDTGGRGFEPGKAKRLSDDKNYIINVGSYEKGVTSSAWETVTGFSEAIITYIQALERV